MSQVDLAREAAHLYCFIYNFRRWRDVSFLRPVFPLVHPTILVETYEQGESVAHHVDQLDGHNCINTTLADIGIHALMKMLLQFMLSVASLARTPPPSPPWVDNFIDSDMYLGNMLVRVPYNKSLQNWLAKLKSYIIFLDVGITAELSEEVEESFDFWDTLEGDLVHPSDCMHQLLNQVRHHEVSTDENVCTVIVIALVLR
ncbi:hypothetical protein Cgig2_021419 [Carnegiea gigantea]|uniref:Uncharacterized protein n=1 Tax=Carnegiea gigantea TaxID=171969 RepID=A0A9Q1GR66_9CARY|nr:hypothetical protein Cgig2_021419 [Carnegiea gigantea]